jgi:hypothetical protein
MESEIEAQDIGKRGVAAQFDALERVESITACPAWP